MKKNRLIIFILLVALVVIGCSGKGGTKLSQDQILEEILKAQNDIKSVKLHGDVNVKIAVGESPAIEAGMKFDMDLIQEPLAVGMKAEMNMPMFFGPDPVKIELYSKDGMNYTKDFVSGEWKVTASKDDPTFQLGSANETAEMQKKLLTQISTEMKDKFTIKEEGKLYKMEFSGSQEDFMKLLEIAQSGQPGGDLTKQSLSGLDKVKFDKFGFTTSYDVATKLPKEMTFFIQANVSEGAQKANIDLSMVLTYVDVNTLKSIEIPKEALDAKPE